MCKIKNLNTTKSDFSPMEFRKNKSVMPYRQIQFNLDCICMFADKTDKPIDMVFLSLDNKGGLDLLQKLYRQKPRPTIRVAVNRLARYMSEQ